MKTKQTNLLDFLPDKRTSIIGKLLDFLGFYQTPIAYKKSNK